MVSDRDIMVAMANLLADEGLLGDLHRAVRALAESEALVAWSHARTNPGARGPERPPNAPAEIPDHLRPEAVGLYGDALEYAKDAWRWYLSPGAKDALRVTEPVQC